MKAFIESCIARNDPGRRSKDDLQSMLPWFRRYGKNVLKEAADEMLLEILQNCTYQKFKKDKIIILQGDYGDSFYILVEGQVCVYVKDLDYSNDDSKKRRISLYSGESRNLLGSCVLTEGEGYSFGEYALMDEKCLRKASVVADEDSSIIIVNRTTYNNSLKNLQTHLLLERDKFIAKNVLFGSCNINVKELIKLSLRKISIPYDTNLVTQGEQRAGLIFMISGSGRLTVEASRHEFQYPEYFPLDFTLYDHRYEEFPELKPPASTTDPTEEECLAELTPKFIRLKRTGDYAALERYTLHHNKQMCIVQSGEIIGDLELLFNLKTNLYSVTCIESTEAFILEDVHIDRIHRKTNALSIIDTLKKVIHSKLDHRERYFMEIPIPFMLFLKIHLYSERHEYPREYPKMINEKVLPSPEAEWQHLIKMYLQNKAPLFPPCVKGSVYLKDLMKRNAYQRKRKRMSQASSSDINIQISVNSLDRFPIRQKSIFRIHKEARNSIHFLELLNKEIRKRKEGEPKSHEQVISRTITKNSLLEKSTLMPKISTSSFNFPTLETESEIVESDRESLDEQDSLTTKEFISKLQKTEIRFLNTLCSDKSRYEMKLRSPEHVKDESNRTHFLPKLQNQGDVIKKEDPPKKGARIVIRPRLCDALTSTYRLVDHSHRIDKMVSKISRDGLDKVRLFVSDFMKLNIKKSV